MKEKKNVYFVLIIWKRLVLYLISVWEHIVAHPQFLVYSPIQQSTSNFVMLEFYQRIVADNEENEPSVGKRTCLHHMSALITEVGGYCLSETKFLSLCVSSTFHLLISEFLPQAQHWLYIYFPLIQQLWQMQGRYGDEKEGSWRPKKLASKSWMRSRRVVQWGRCRSGWGSWGRVPASPPRTCARPSGPLSTATSWGRSSFPPEKMQ